MRWAIVCALLLATPAFAAAEEDGASELEAKRAQLKKLREERDAALVNANVYVLPKYKLEAQKKQEEIDALEKEIAELEKKEGAAKQK
jgi:hypothetical protein